jgi:hypothetical protein
LQSPDETCRAAVASGSKEQSMTHISLVQAEEFEFPPRNETMRAVRLRAWRGLAWPVNEVLLASLLGAGKSCEEIARLYAVAPERVDALRDVYGV